MKKIIILTSFLIQSLLLLSQTTRLDSLWNDPAVEQRITTGIEKNRKGDFTITLQPFKGKTEIEIRQVRHEFLFGANGFMINGFETAAKNKQFEDTFASLFNLACVPFYWKTLEPNRGSPRYASNSEPIYRRPPPDVVLEFCKRYGITPKGHTLVWNNPTHAVPDWMPADTSAVEQLITKRINALGEKYGNLINTWDVVNEALHYFPTVTMPKDYVFKSFQAAMKAYPPSAKLMINEVTSIWENNNREYSPYYLMIQNLLLRGCRIDGLGMQFHFFSEQLYNNTVAGMAMTPNQLFAVLDLYATFKKPLQVSEITIPTLPNSEEGKKLQAVLTRNFYRLWFSHPSVEAIIWWNMVDGTAVKGEDKWNGGLLNNDFSPKPSYEVLNNLLNSEWKTNIKTTVSNQATYSFRGFYGEYEVTVKQGKKIIIKKFVFNKEGQNSASIQ